MLIGPLGTKWNFNQNSKFFIKEIVFENIVGEMAAILSWGRWVNRAPDVRHLTVLGHPEKA